MEARRTLSERFTRMASRGGAALVIFLAITPAAPAQQPPSPAPAAKVGSPAAWVINLRDTELRVFAEQISEMTGRTLILDPSVKGQVTVISAEPVDAGAAWELFQSVLRANGFAALPAGTAWKIVPQGMVAQGGAPLDQGGGGRTQNLITRLVVLRNLPAESAARVLKPMIASFGYLEALPRPNALIVTDNAENVRRVEELALMLDHSDGSRVETVPLSHAVAKSVAPLIEKMLAQDSNSGPVAGVAPRIVADERSNTLIVRAETQTIAQIRQIAADLDKPGLSGVSLTTRVLHLRHADAESTVEILKGLIGGRGASENPVAAALSPTGNDFASSLQAGLGQSFPPQIGIPAGASLPSFGGSTGSSLGGAGGFGAGNGQVASSLGQQRRGSSRVNGFSTSDLAIQPDPTHNAIVVRATQPVLQEIEQLIEQLDLRRPQVLIEAAIVEISGEDAENLGIQLGAGGAALNRSGTLGATSFSGSGVPISSILQALQLPLSGVVGQEGFTFGLSRANEFAILVQALATSSKANLLSTPSLTTLDNEPAEIIVGQNVPFRTGNFTTPGNTAEPFTTIQRQDVGITLKVVPRVTDGDVIRLEIQQEVSSLSNATVAGAADLITNRRVIDTTVLADNNQTIVLGGLIRSDETHSDSRVPVLGDIPLLGALFGSQGKTRDKDTLFVFLRATILRDREAVAAATSRDYGKMRDLDLLTRQNESLLLAPSVPKLPLDLEEIY